MCLYSEARAVTISLATEASVILSRVGANLAPLQDQHFGGFKGNSEMLDGWGCYKLIPGIYLYIWRLRTHAGCCTMWASFTPVSASTRLGEGKEPEWIRLSSVEDPWVYNNESYELLYLPLSPVRHEARRKERERNQEEMERKVGNGIREEEISKKTRRLVEWSKIERERTENNAKVAYRKLES